MTTRSTAAIATSILILITATFAGATQESSNESIISTQIAALGSKLHAADKVKQFYANRNAQFAWITHGKDRVNNVIALLKDGSKDGLDPEDYSASELGEIAKNSQLNDNAELDIRITDSILSLSSDLLFGRRSTKGNNPLWSADRRDTDLALELNTVCESNSLGAMIEKFRPHHPQYGRLVKALAAMESAASKGIVWPKVPDGPKLESGATGDRVKALYDRLSAEGYRLSPPLDNIYTLGGDLQNALMEFQGTHGLEPDGVIGKATVTALNASLDERVKQLKINLDRWRALPRDLGNRYVLVDVPAFKLHAFDGTSDALQMKVIVGQLKRKTPLFSSKMKYVVLNPQWFVPNRIAVEDKLPILRKDPTYAARHKIKIYQTVGGETTRIDATQVDWTQVDRGSFNYHFQQDPGPGNALGSIKFLFPNKYDVYLHDTSNPELFSGTVRTFSSGCVRIHKPLELAQYVFKDDPEWTKDQIEATIRRGAQRVITLTEEIPVHITYLTAWVNEEGKLELYNDVYGYDR